jgi:inorganic pyrophosphatase
VDVEVVIEIPQGSRDKYVMDHAAGRIRLDRRLFSASRYPADCGFIPGTLDEDGSPLDALVLTGHPVFPGSYVLARPVAIFWLAGEHGPDARILTVPAHDPRSSALRDLPDLPSRITAGIGRFFGVYAGLEPGKSPGARGWQDRLAAEHVIESAVIRARGGPDTGSGEVRRLRTGAGARRAVMRTRDGLRAGGTAATAVFRPPVGGWVVRVPRRDQAARAWAAPVISRIRPGAGYCARVLAAERAPQVPQVGRGGFAAGGVEGTARSLNSRAGARACPAGRDSDAVIGPSPVPGEQDPSASRQINATTCDADPAGSTAGRGKPARNIQSPSRARATGSASAGYSRPG